MSYVNQNEVIIFKSVQALDTENKKAQDEVILVSETKGLCLDMIHVEEIVEYSIYQRNTERCQNLPGGSWKHWDVRHLCPKSSPDTDKPACRMIEPFIHRSPYNELVI